jgi:hypothetical protein
VRPIVKQPGSPSVAQPMGLPITVARGAAG